MEGAHKRRGRVEILDDDNSFQFFDENGIPIPANQLFRAKRDVVIPFILFTENPAFLLTLIERAGTEGLRFVKKYELWRRVFQKVYPERYTKYYDPRGHGKMELGQRNKLDRNSRQPGRPYTYWKRYYELLQRKGTIEEKPGVIATGTSNRIRTGSVGLAGLRRLVDFTNPSETRLNEI